MRRKPEARRRCHGRSTPVATLMLAESALTSKVGDIDIAAAALHATVTAQTEAAVRFLLDGANPNLADSNGATALMDAAGLGLSADGGEGRC